MVTSDFHNFTAAKSRQSSPEKVVEPEESISDISQPTKFRINHDLLKVYEEETRNVKTVLESIFVDETILNEPEEEVNISSHSEGNTIIRLEEKHFALYEILITKEEWAFDEVRAICGKLTLMADGAIEEINDWAYDNVDAPVIEDGTTVFIDLEVVEEISTL